MPEETQQPPAPPEPPKTVTVTPLKKFTLGATSYPAGQPAEIDPAYVPLLQDQGFLAKEGEEPGEPKATDEAVNPEVIKPLEPSETSPDEVVAVEEGDTSTYEDPIAETGVNEAVVTPHRKYRKKSDPGTPDEG